MKWGSTLGRGLPTFPPSPGANYGWSEREGTFLVVHNNENDVFDLPADDAVFGFTYPVIQYDHDENDRAISGGYVYRGSQISTLLGEYVFGDLVSGRLFLASAASLDGTGQVAFEELRLIDAADGLEKSLLAIIGGGTPASRADLRFGTDDDGEIYLVTKQDGSIRLLSAPPCGSGPACADDTVSVSDISVRIETIGRKHTRASAVVTIVDETGALIEGATVHGRWSSLVDQSQSDVTDVLGEAIFRSSKVSNSLVGEFVFAVTDVVIASHVYDPSANVETSACINTDGDLCGAGPGEPTVLHVSDITVTLTNKGKNWYGDATVTVLDTSGIPASNAVITGLWTHEPAGGGSNDLNQVVGNTNASGQLTTTSSKLRASLDDRFRFTVNAVSRASDTYDRDASVRDNFASVQ